MRKISLLVVALVAAFAVTGCASMGGGYVGPKPYPGPLGDVVAGNLGLTCPGDVFIGPPINRCLRHIGGGVGRYTNYPMYWGGSTGLRLSDADKVALMCGVGTGATATLSGASIRTVLASSVLGYVACRAIGMVAGRGNRGGNDEMIVVADQTSPVGGPQAPSRNNDWNPILQRQQAGTYQRGVVNGRPVNNRTGLDALLWVGESDVAIEISRGGHTQVPRNPGGLEAETIETAPGGREVRKPALVVPNHDLDGWDIIVPAGR